MAPHSSTLAWKIPWMGEPGGLQSMGSLSIESVMASNHLILCRPLLLLPSIFPRISQPVHSEGDQPWDFFGRNDVKAATPVLWPPHAKS